MLKWPGKGKDKVKRFSSLCSATGNQFRPSFIFIYFFNLSKCLSVKCCRKGEKGPTLTRMCRKWVNKRAWMYVRMRIFRLDIRFRTLSVYKRTGCPSIRSFVLWFVCLSIHRWGNYFINCLKSAHRLGWNWRLVWNGLSFMNASNGASEGSLTSALRKCIKHEVKHFTMHSIHFKFIQFTTIGTVTRQTKFLKERKSSDSFVFLYFGF